MWFVSLLFLSYTIIHTLYMERHSHNSSCSSRWPWLRRVCVWQDWARVCACVSVWWSQAWWVGHCRWAAGSEQCHSERCAEAHSRGSSPPPPPIERHHQTFIHTLTLYLSICNTHTIQITDLSSLSHTHWPSCCAEEWWSVFSRISCPESVMRLSEECVSDQ